MFFHSSIPYSGFDTGWYSMCITLVYYSVIYYSEHDCPMSLPNELAYATPPSPELTG